MLKCLLNFTQVITKSYVMRLAFVICHWCRCCDKMRLQSETRRKPWQCHWSYKPVADPGFPRGGAANSPENCMKLKEFGPLSGGRASKILLCRSATVNPRFTCKVKRKHGTPSLHVQLLSKIAFQLFLFLVVRLFEQQNNRQTWHCVDIRFIKALTSIFHLAVYTDRKGR